MKLTFAAFSIVGKHPMHMQIQEAMTDEMRRNLKTKMLAKFISGVPYKDIWDSLRKPRSVYGEIKIDQLLRAAKKEHDDQQPAPTASPVAIDKPSLAEKRAAARQQLKANDNTIVTQERLKNVSNLLQAEYPEEELQADNVQLMARSGAITYNDIAFILLVHWNSVKGNGRSDPWMRGTSPFDRIQKASVAFEYRPKPFDDRQIRYALDICQTLEITEQIQAATRGRAGVWTRTREARWTSLLD